MIALTPEQFQEYNGRLKAQRDEEARILQGQQQGIEIGEARGIEIGQARGIEIGEARGREIGQARGIEKGQFLGQITLLQQLLKQPVAAEDQLAGLSIEQLSQMVADLKQQLSLSGHYSA